MGGKIKTHHTKTLICWLVWYTWWNKSRKGRNKVKYVKGKITYSDIYIYKNKRIHTTQNHTFWYHSMMSCHSIFFFFFCGALYNEKMSSRDLSSLPCHLLEMEHFIVWLPARRQKMKQTERDAGVFQMAIMKPKVRARERVTPGGCSVH